jgi:hypothetical protein
MFRNHNGKENKTSTHEAEHEFEESSFYICGLSNYTRTPKN